MGGGKISEFEFRNVLDVSYGAYVVKGAYSGRNNPKGTSNHNDAVAIIRELLRGKTADVRLNAGEASTAVSIIQIFTNSTDNIATKLNKMEELANMASSPDYSQVQVEEMQKEFKSLVNEINEIVKGTEYNYNKIFTAAGESISIPIGDGSRVDIFTRDFSFNAQDLDLTAETKSALSSIKKAIKELNEYRTYLSREAARVEDATATIESELESAMGVELDDFTPDIAMETASYIMKSISEDKSTSLIIQGNVTGDETLRLLKSRD